MTITDWQIRHDCTHCGAPRCACRVTKGIVQTLCSTDELEPMFDAYLECALWSSTDVDDQGDMGEPLDENYGPDDLSDDAWLSALRDCSGFLEGNAADIKRARLKTRTYDVSQAGHDFWLTRNGYGAGFWDRGLGTIGERLTKASKSYGSVDLMIIDRKILGH